MKEPVCFWHHQAMFELAYIWMQLLFIFFYITVAVFSTCHDLHSDVFTALTQI